MARRGNERYPPFRCCALPRFGAEAPRKLAAGSALCLFLFSTYRSGCRQHPKPRQGARSQGPFPHSKCSQICSLACILDWTRWSTQRLCICHQRSPVKSRHPQFLMVVKGHLLGATSKSAYVLSHTRHSPAVGNGWGCLRLLHLSSQPKEPNTLDGRECQAIQCPRKSKGTRQVTLAKLKKKKKWVETKAKKKKKRLAAKRSQFMNSCC